jgi:TPR repeat protein
MACRLYKFVFIIGLALTITACANSFGRLNSGIANFKEQNYRAAFIKLMPIAEAGNPDAQYAIGYMFYYGQGVVTDKDKAFYWMKLASRQGHPEANKALQIIYNQPRSPYSPSTNPKKRPI